MLDMRIRWLFLFFFLIEILFFEEQAAVLFWDIIFFVSNQSQLHIVDVDNNMMIDDKENIV